MKKTKLVESTAQMLVHDFMMANCIDGLTEYAAELRQRAGERGKEQTPILRDLVDKLVSYWNLAMGQTDGNSYLADFDQRMQEADQAEQPLAPSQEQVDYFMKGLCGYVIDMVSGQGSEYAKKAMECCEKLMREAAEFWGIASPTLDPLFEEMQTEIQKQQEYEMQFEAEGSQQNL